MLFHSLSSTRSFIFARYSASALLTQFVSAAKLLHPLLIPGGAGQQGTLRFFPRKSVFPDVFQDVLCRHYGHSCDARRLVASPTLWVGLASEALLLQPSVTQGCRATRRVCQWAQGGRIPTRWSRYSVLGNCDADDAGVLVEFLICRGFTQLELFTPLPTLAWTCFQLPSTDL